MPEQLDRGAAVAVSKPDTCIQPAGYFLELSRDWIIQRASENVHHLLGEQHVEVIDEPLGQFVHAQALHDLRNLFSRMSGTTGIGRAYGVKLTDSHEFVDIAFQHFGSQILLEAIPSTAKFGECFGTISGLISGLSNMHGHALLEGAARRMRAMTGYDRVVLICGEDRAESSRSAFPASPRLIGDVPPMLVDIDAQPVPIFPRRNDDRSVHHALLRSSSTVDRIRAEGVCACLQVFFAVDEVRGEFRCDNRTPRQAHFELHAAAELFAQLFAMQVKIDRHENHPAK